MRNNKTKVLSNNSRQALQSLKFEIAAQLGENYQLFQDQQKTVFIPEQDVKKLINKPKN